MFTLAHISDPHLGPLPKITLSELASKRLTGFVNWQRRRKQLFGNTLERLIEDLEAIKPDHIALTGDIVNLAADLEIVAATAWLKSFSTPADLSVIPGNHDAYVPGALGKVMRAWHVWMHGDGPSEDWRSSEQAFPYLRVRKNVALIGVSTAISSPPFMASGYFGRRQARRLAEMLHKTGEAGLFRVIMIHHPPIRGATAHYKRMIGIRRFAAALSLGGAELVLHGHTHKNSLYWLNCATGKVPVVGIASASQNHGGKKPASSYNLFRISGEKGSWVLLRQRFGLSADGKHFNLAHEDVLLVGRIAQPA